MGRYTDSLNHRMRGRRVAADLNHPRGFKGTVMWCSLCRAEVMRMPVRHRLTHADQQAAFDRHMTVCEMKDAPGLKATRREIERGARRLRRPLRWWWVAALALAAVAVGWVIAQSRR